MMLYTAGGKLKNVHEWWECLTTVGPDYGYASKTLFIVKEGQIDEAKSLFEGTDVVINEEGKK